MSIDYDKLWNEIDTLVSEEFSKMKPYEKTITQLSIAWGVGDEKAKSMAKKLEESGQLKSRIAMSHNGKRITVYFPLAEEDRK